MLSDYFLIHVVDGMNVQGCHYWYKVLEIRMRVAIERDVFAKDWSCTVYN